VPARRSVLDTVTGWSTARAPAAIVAQNVGVGLVYASLMELVLLPQLVGGLRTTPVWPANGFAVAAVWLLGLRVLPGIALSAAIVMAQQVPLPVALVGSLAPVGQVLLVTWVLRTGRFDARLERARDPLILTLIAAPSGSAVSSSIGTLASWMFGALPAGSGEAFWLSWFMRAWLGIATTAPLVFAPLRARAMPLTGSRLAEAATIVLGLIFTSLIVVGLWVGPAADAPFSFLALPFVIWASLRFGARGASIVVALLTVLAILLAVIRIGPVVDLPVQTAQASTFLFLLMAAISGQVLAAMNAERDDALKKRVQLEEQLRHSQKMESVGRLAGGIAHDFNNLLTAILGYTDIVVHGMDPKDPRRADAEQIERAAMRAADLTRQMLSFSRREAQQASVLDLNRLLGKVEPMLRRVIGEDVKLTIVSKAPRPFVRADAGQMEQVILNLAVNARDAMPQGGRLLVETAEAMVDEDTAAENHEARLGSHVMLSVTDTGVGMPPSVRTRLFEPYFTTKPAGKGTGLGLSTVYGIVRQSDGHITVTSEVGSGTTFRVMLPMTSTEPAKEKDSSVQKLPGGTEHILLIEDDPSVRRLAKDLLVRLGYSITEAASGRAGIALGSDDTRHFDLLVCDVILGDMSGPSAAEALRALRPAMRVLYVSGYTDDAIVRTGVLEEGKAFLPKPFTPLQLARKVREVLEDREAGAA
jgi:signal transduction histidine kinase/ActR/RegA family two-component response regulator